MSDITVIIYSYKGKLLKDVVNSLFENSNYKIDVIIFDQHPLLRSELFENKNVMYKHLFWDWIHGPLLYKFNALGGIQTKYTMIISDNVFLSKDWDKKFIDFVTEKKIISGNHQVSLEQKNLFYLNKQISDIENFELTQYVDRSLLFGFTSTIKNITFPKYLKYNGEEEVFSLEFFTNGVDIYACPTSTYNVIGNNSLELLYVPFSLNHNYNNAIKLLKTGSNEFCSVINRTRTLNEFNNFHNNIFKNTKYLPFESNDVLYFPENLNFDKVDARKFVARTRAIH